MTGSFLGGVPWPWPRDVVDDDWIIPRETLQAVDPFTGRTIPPPFVVVLFENVPTALNGDS